MADEVRDTFSVDKSTGTFADPLLTEGWADVLCLVTGGEVTIYDRGPVFELQLARPLTAELIEQAAGLSGLRFLLTRNNQALAPEGMNQFDYDAERAAETAYFAARRVAPKRAGSQAPDDSALPPPPHLDLPFFKLINQMSAITAYNEVAVRWHRDQAHWPAYIRLLADLFAQYPNDVAAAETAWKALARDEQISGGVRVTAAQIINPAMGKGGDAAKANSLAPGNKDSFWLVEYLKFLGARVGALPLTVRGSKDRKTYVPLPAQMQFNVHRRIMADLRQRLYAASAIKLDVLADLEYTRAFLEQWRAAHDEEQQLWDANPGNFVSGLAVGFYKDLGSALALLNLSRMRLPQWMRVTTPDDAADYLELLAEHTAIVRGLEESHSDEYALLQAYRTFLSARDLRAFYDFTAGYAPVVMRRLERPQPHQPARPFTLSNLEVLLMGHSDEHPELVRIFTNPGFRNLATAIRLSTIVPQGQKARGQARLYNVRYGLGDELKRKAGYPRELAQALGEFVHSYNQETVQVFERTKQKPRRSLVTDHDLEQVLELIATIDSRTVGHLLIAFGYARSAYQAATEPDAGSNNPLDEPVSDDAELEEANA